MPGVHEVQPGGRIDLAFADAGAQLTAAGVLQIRVRDDDALTLQIPTDGNLAALRRVLRELDEAAVNVVDLASHTPDLDDVFLAPTGPTRQLRGTQKRRGAVSTTGAYALRDSTTCCDATCATCSATTACRCFRSSCQSSSCSCSSTCVRRHAGQRDHRRRATRRLRQLPHPRNAPVHRRGRGADHRRLGGQGHDQGHDRSLQDDANLATRSARGPRPRQPALDRHKPRVVIAVALPVGFHSAASPLRRLAALGLLLVLAIALIWLSVVFGLVATSVEAASNMPMLLILLPFLGGGFVPVASMSAGLGWFAKTSPLPDHQQRAGPSGQPAHRQHREDGDRVVPRHRHCRPSVGQVPSPTADRLTDTPTHISHAGRGPRLGVRRYR